MMSTVCLAYRGEYAEYAVAAANNLGRKPASLGHVHAASQAVAGGVGHIAVQLAKWRGAQVIGTASAGNEAFLRELGVDQFINYRTTAFESIVQEVDVVIDAIPREADAVTDVLARETMARSRVVLRDGGIQVSICAHPVPDLEAARRGLRGAHAGARPSNHALNRIEGLVDEGKLRPDVGTILPLQETRQAHELIQAGHTRAQPQLGLDRFIPQIKIHTLQLLYIFVK